MSQRHAILSQKARNQAIQYALIRPESAIVLAGTLLLTFLLAHPFPWWPWWGWPALGGLAWAALIFVSLTDPEAYVRQFMELLQGEMNPKLIQEPALRQQFQAALEYQRKLELAIQQQHATALRPWLETAADRLADWLGAFYALAVRVDATRREPQVAEARTRLPQEIETLASRRRFERNPQALLRLGESVEGLGKRWEALRQLEAQLHQGTRLLERSLAGLPALYAQLTVVTAADVAAGRGAPLEATLQAQSGALIAVEQGIAQVVQEIV